MLQRLLVGIALVLAALFAWAAMQPDSYRVERSARIDAPLGVVFDQVSDFRKWKGWSPWDKLDPDMNKTFDGPGATVGSSYTWAGNDRVGAGRLTITSIQPPFEIEQRLEFTEPMVTESVVRFALSPHGDGSVIVTWSMEGTNNLMSKFVGIFMSPDRMVGTQLEHGLIDLKLVAEKQAGR